jgi:4-hydroxy-3-methylbut-2-enyl diphosphate reductase
VPVVPRSLEKRLGFQRLKDIPGSKTLSAGLAWAFITAVLPPVALGFTGLAPLVLCFVYTLVLVLVRCALFDILDVQGDLIVGKETIPIALGEDQTRRLLWQGLGLLAALMLLAPVLGLGPSLAWALLAPAAGVAVMQIALDQVWILPGSLSEGLVDLNFSLAGVVALIWFYW